MKSRMLIEMMSALSLVLLSIMATATYGQGEGGMGMSGMGGMDAAGGYGMGSGSDDAISRPSLSYTVDDKPYRATRVRSFRYAYQSFRPRELAYVRNNGDMGGGMGMDMGGMSSGMPGGGYGSGGGYSGGPTTYPGGIGDGSDPGAAGGGSAGYGTSNNDPASERMTIKIHAYLFDKEKVNDRTHIELMIEQPNELGMAGMGGPGGMPGGYGAGGMSGGFSEGGMPGGIPSSPSRMKPLASLGTPKTKASARLSQSEIKLVSDIICQTIWKADVVKALFASKGQGDSATENEKFLKQLLAEQYDTQLARQEMEAESIKRRLELLVDELKRRKLAKDRVVDVQWGRLILDAQGLLNNDR